jgi:hypothetical protein
MIFSAVGRRGTISAVPLESKPMNVRTLRSRLAAFDDDMEVHIAPSISAERIGEGRNVRVPHPLRQRPLADLSVVGDIDTHDYSVGTRRVVLVFDETAVGDRAASVRPGQREGSGSSGPMAWEWQYSEESNFARVDLSGTFHAPAFDVMFSELVSEDCIAPGRRILFDDRLLDLSQPTIKSSYTHR